MKLDYQIDLLNEAFQQVAETQYPSLILSYIASGFAVKADREANDQLSQEYEKLSKELNELSDRLYQQEKSWPASPWPLQCYNCDAEIGRLANDKIAGKWICDICNGEAHHLEFTDGSMA